MDIAHVALALWWRVRHGPEVELSRIAAELNRNHVPTKRSGETLKLRGDAAKRLTSGRWQGGNVAKILSPNNRTVQTWLQTQSI